MMGQAVKAIVHELAGERRAITRQFVRGVLPEPDRNDPRQMVGRKRALLDEVDERYRLTVDELLASLSECESPLRSEHLRKLKLLLGSIPEGSRLPCPPTARLEAAIADTHPSLGNVDEIVSALSVSLRSKDPVPILLEGPAGTGKTSLSEAIAKALGCPFVKRDFPGMSVQELYGSVGAPSLVTEAIAAFDGKPGILLIDEVDKPSPLPDRALLSVLDTDTKRYVDSYLNLPIDLSKWLIVLTANEAESVSPYVRSRVRTVEVPGYTPADKIKVAKGALIERAAQMLEQDPARFSEDALRYVAWVDDDAGLRGFERRILDVAAAFPGRPVCAKDVSEMFPTDPPYGFGVRVVMPRSGAKGGAALACVDGRRDRELKRSEALVAPLAFESCLRISELALRSRGIELSCRVVASMVGSGDDIDHAFCPYAQLGIAVMLALVEEGLPTDVPSVAFIGELRPSGEIKDDERNDTKVPFAISRARAHGVGAVVCSHAFAEKAKACAEQNEVDLVPVGDVAQAVEYAKNVQELDSFLKELAR